MSVLDTMAIRDILPHRYPMLLVDRVVELEEERIVGIKDSSGDLKYFESLMSLRAARPDWSIMIGPEAMLPPQPPPLRQRLLRQ